MIISIKLYIEAEGDEILKELGLAEYETTDALVNVDSIVYALEGIGGTVLYLRGGVPEDESLAFATVATPLSVRELHSKIVSAGMTQN